MAKNQTHSDKLKSIILSLSTCESYQEFQDICNDVKLRMITRALDEADGNFSKAARQLGYKAPSLYQIIQKQCGKLDDYSVQTIEKNKPLPHPQFKETVERFVSLATDRETYEELLNSSEKFFFHKALVENDFNYTQTARALHLSNHKGRYVVKDKIEKYEIDISDKNKNANLNVQDYTEGDPDSINTLLSTTNYQTLKDAYVTAKKQYIYSAFKLPNVKMSEIERQLELDRTSLKVNLKSLFDIDYKSVEQTAREMECRTIPNYKASDIMLENSSSLKSLHDFYTRARSALIIRTLEENEYNQTQTSNMLGMDISTLRSHLKKLNSFDNVTPSTETLHSASTQKTDNVKDTYSIVNFLSTHFSFSEVKDIRLKATKALMQRALSENNFDLQLSAEELDIPITQFKSGLKNFFKVIPGDTLKISGQDRSKIEHTSSEDHESTIKDILPFVKTYDELSTTFLAASKAIATNTWESLNKNSAKAANELGLSEEQLQRLLPERQFD